MSIIVERVVCVSIFLNIPFLFRSTLPLDFTPVVYFDKNLVRTNYSRLKYLVEILAYERFKNILDT